jgi:hydrogenase maturation protein HypF
MALVRRALRVRGDVQGVGFRPFVYRLAHTEGLTGWVRNDGRGVALEVQGGAEAVARFPERLRAEAPPLARITAVEAEERPPQPDEAGFTIGASGGGEVSTGLPPDTAPCPACLVELFDPADRRWRYPFLNCTHCGPRFTVVGALPYDRPNTALADFPLCDACAAEYADPLDRRFHAQPTACPRCGPRAGLRAPGGAGEEGDPIAGALDCLRAGGILALKGLGGYHLACDAGDAEAIERLRARKGREAKPLAVMALNAASLEDWAQVGEAERALLADPRRPITLLPGRGVAPEGLAPGQHLLGAMLPYTPLHYLLFHEAAGRPAGSDWLAEPHPLRLVMTSANPGGEPLVIGDAEADARLAGLADRILGHDRPIVTRCDDSLVRPAADGPLFLRRSRGWVPEPLAGGVPREAPPVLALGAGLKATVCATRGGEAFLSPHVGDLDNPATCTAQEEAVSHLLDLLRIAPQRVACDQHPDFPSTRLAERLAADNGWQLVPVQHHHAHAAAVAAEHGLEGPALALTLDGVGLGSDGGAWGGELLWLDGPEWRRLDHLTPLALPGGDRAAREPWRLAAAALHRLGRGEAIAARFGHRPFAGALARQLARGGVATTTSAGRLFDAAAGLLGLAEESAYEGEAAMRLEAAAARHGSVAPDPAGWTRGPKGLGLDPLLAGLAEETDAGRGAARFHATLAVALADWARAWANRGVERVLLGGGCFQNRSLLEATTAALEAQSLEVYRPRAVPPGDAGLCLGQAWVAAHA